MSAGVSLPDPTSPPPPFSLEERYRPGDWLGGGAYGKVREYVLERRWRWWWCRRWRSTPDRVAVKMVEAER